MASGGFESRYDGLYGDLVLSIAPYITSPLAFLIGMWAPPNAVESQEQVVAKIAAEESYTHANHRKALNNFKNTLTTIWATIFPDADMPEDIQQADYLIRRKIISERPERYGTLLSQFLDEETLLKRFEDITTEVLINYNVVKNPSEIALLKVSRTALRGKIRSVIDDIIEVVSKKREGGVEYGRVI
jgi:hypothetical protein